MQETTSFEPRSLLFVPADSERFITKAANRHADVLVLDLEDGVASTSKIDARNSLTRSVPMLRALGAVIYVRVNNEIDLLDGDVSVALSCGVNGIVMPKVDAPEQLVALSQKMASLASSSSIGIVGLVESPAGICRISEIARSTPRLRGLCLGSEDFAAAMEVEPCVDSLSWPAHALAIAAVAAGVQPMGLVGSVGNFSDLVAYRELVAQSRRLGMRGASCIHPSQVDVLNQVFGASEFEISEAKKLLALFDSAAREGRGAIALNGRMVDEPVAQRARRMLQREHLRRATGSIGSRSKPI
jgi:citrate lyase subunit beta/citryl-CoA lyase